MSIYPKLHKVTYPPRPLFKTGQPSLISRPPTPTTERYHTTKHSPRLSVRLILFSIVPPGPQSIVNSLRAWVYNRAGVGKGEILRLPGPATPDTPRWFWAGGRSQAGSEEQRYCEVDHIKTHHLKTSGLAKRIPPSSRNSRLWWPNSWYQTKNPKNKLKEHVPKVRILQYYGVLWCSGSISPDSDFLRL